MLIENIRKRVQDIATMAMLGDYEAAHAREDSLYHDFIKYVEICVEEGKWDPDMKQKVAAVLGTKHIDFQRWCA